MQQLLFLVAVLACPVGMGLMMWFMMKGMGGTSGQTAGSSQPMVVQPWQPRLDQLPEQPLAVVPSEAPAQEIAALKAQLAELERQNRRLAEQLDQFAAHSAAGGGAAPHDPDAIG